MKMIVDERSYYFLTALSEHILMFLRMMRSLLLGINITFEIYQSHRLPQVIILVFWTDNCDAF